MAVVTVTFSSSFNGAVTFVATYDSVTGVVASITVTNRLARAVDCTVAGHTYTFQPGLNLVQDVSALALNILKTPNFFPATRVSSV